VTGPCVEGTVGVAVDGVVGVGAQWVHSERWRRQAANPCARATAREATSAPPTIHHWSFRLMGVLAASTHVGARPASRLAQAARAAESTNRACRDLEQVVRIDWGKSLALRMLFGGS